MEFSRESEEEDGLKTTKHNKRILFQRMAPYPQRKVITFNRYTDDFVFYVNYGDLSYLSEEDMKLVNHRVLFALLKIPSSVSRYLAIVSFWPVMKPSFVF